MEVENQHPNLTVTDECGEEQTFHCENCQLFWMECESARIRKDPGFCRRFESIKHQLKPMFLIAEINKRDVKWRKMLKILYHLLTGRNPENASSTSCMNEAIKVEQFVNLVKRFGCVKKLDNNDGNHMCFLLQEVQNLLENSIAITSSRMTISWFAGHMTGSDAHSRLRNKEEGTFLVRLSESRADKGAFVVAVKAEGNDDVRQYLIVGEPERMGSDEDDDEYNNRFRLFINGEPEEESYLDLTTFIDERCKYQDIEEGVCCKKICDNLPLNADFTGYRLASIVNNEIVCNV